MANQFTKGTRVVHDESTKDRIRAEHLSRRMYKFAKSKGEKAKEHEMSQAQVAAAKVLIERGKPALQAIEQRIVEESKTAEEQLADLAHMLVEHPELLKRILEAHPGARAALRSMLDGTPTLVQVQQSSAA